VAKLAPSLMFTPPPRRLLGRGDARLTFALGVPATLCRMNRLRIVTVAFACALIALAAGLWLGGHPDSLPQPLRDAFVDEERALRAEIVETIEENFYKKVDTDKLDEQSLKGIVRSLDDRFSHYLTPEEAKHLEQAVSGRFDGVGMNVQQNRRGLLVVTVFEGSPALKAGIRKGDVITAVDGKSIAGVASDVSTARIKGEPGTTVRLTVLHSGTKEPRTLDVKRARIEVPVAQDRLVTRGGAKLGVIELLSFSSGAHGRLRQKIDDLLDRGARGIVLDLRGNGGGLLREAVLVASVFIEDGTIVSTKGRTKPERDFDAEGDAIDDDVPLVVLVDRGSASASEIVTGALRDRERATVVGTRTFGKGVFQEIEPLSNGGVLDLTVGNYYLPDGESISRRGIKPQVAARDKPRTRRDEALPVALRELLEKVR
jgi:carboxyl-terminal processing protease